MFFGKAIYFAESNSFVILVHFYDTNPHPVKTNCSQFVERQKVTNFHRFYSQTVSPTHVYKDRLRLRRLTVCYAPSNTLNLKTGNQSSNGNDMMALFLFCPLTYPRFDFLHSFLCFVRFSTDCII